MASGPRRRTLITVAGQTSTTRSGAVRRDIMSAAVMTIQRRTWNGARAMLAALAVAVAVLISLLIITNNDSGASSSPTRSGIPVAQPHVSHDSADVACGTGHPC